MKEIKVKLYRHENDDYNELYEVIDSNADNKYFIRHTYFGGEWYFVSDSLGYCELDQSCPEDYIFIVCDRNGKELFKDSNGEICNPYTTPEKKAKAVWNSIRGKYPTANGLDNWLKSFITRDIKENLKNKYCIYYNWTTFWYDETSKEVIEKFEHLGEKYCIYRVTKKHKYCDCEWIEYMAGIEKMDEYDNYTAYFGSWFDKSTVGECYGDGEAVELVENALKEIYRGKYSISRVYKIYGMAYEKKMRFRGAAEMLLGGNYERVFVD